MRHLLSAIVVLLVLIIGICVGCAYASYTNVSAPQDVKNKDVKNKVPQQDLEAENRDQKKTIASLEAQISDGQDNLAKLKANLEAIAKDSKKLAAETKALGKEKQDLTNQLSAADKAREQLEANLAQEVQKLTKQVAVSKALSEDLRTLNKEKDDLGKRIMIVDAKNQKLETEAKDLDAQVKKYRPDLSIAQDPKLYSDEKKLLVVSFHPGKKEEAQLLCKALGFEFVNAFGPKNDLLLYRWTQPITMETLNILGHARSIIRSVQPRTSMDKQKSDRESYSYHNHGNMDGDLRMVKFDPQKDNVAIKQQAASFLSQRWALTTIEAPTGWEKLGISRHTEPVIVAIIDRGVDITHPDLRPYIWRNPKASPYADAAAMLIPGNPIARLPLYLVAGPEECRLADYATFGARFDIERGRGGSGNVFPTPEKYAEKMVNVVHGTHCAGIVVTTANGHRQIAKVNVKILPIRVVSDSDLPDAVAYAIKSKAKILSMSFGYTKKEWGLCAQVHDAIDQATNAGLLVVCAAGNVDKDGGRDIDQKELFVAPACCGRVYDDISQRVNYPDPKRFRVDRIICVGSVDRNNIISEFSCYGKVTVDLMAPGGFGEPKAKETRDLSVMDPESQILSTIPVSPEILDISKWQHARGPYAALYGTSQAAPHVAGAAALLWSHPKYQQLKAEDIKKKLMENVRKEDKLKEKCVTEGVLDLGFLLQEFEVAESPAAATLFDQGYHHFWSGRYADAVRSFDGASDLHHHPVYFYYGAFARASLGDKVEATKDLGVAVRMDKTKSFGSLGSYMELFQGYNRMYISSVRDFYIRTGKLPDSNDIWKAWLDPVIEVNRQLSWGPINATVEAFPMPIETQRVVPKK